ncbi:Polyprenol reductase like protein [Verticillium longisporum]|uniref:Polyprenal reductase n=2 Tax=Verticillium longisporum TaxID=100787 RepID=A0A8I3AL04_VERLO|nr:Polyprenol reductase like protein [Verticillium longisporum]KAG7128840.1 Polyprenol reductase like protein [Verticillium longisporum]
MALPAPLLEIIAGVITDTAPSQWCQAFFAIATITALSVQLIPKASQSLLLDYGPRATQAKYGAPGDRTDWLYTSVRLVTAVQVPHSWFNHFYVASVAASAFWAHQYFAGRSLLLAIITKQAAVEGPSMGKEQVWLVWILMALQGGRRLFECFYVMKPSRSKMWLGHWALGLIYYLDMSVAIWIEGSRSLLHSEADLAVSSRFSTSQLVGIAIFTTGWLQQHKCHQYLASLKKYTLPEQGLFRHIVCAHYTCECLIYGGLAMAAAPAGRWFNRTLICGLWFVVVNLGSTAHGTKKWYSEKFGEARVAPKWKMIPFVF